MSEKHLDEAKPETVRALRDILAARDSPLSRAVLIEDVFGLLRPVLWPSPTLDPAEQEKVKARLRNAAGRFWADEWWASNDGADARIYERAWTEGRQENGERRLRVADRWRSRTAWRHDLSAPPWEPAPGNGASPIVVFHSFKGGVGRSTALAGFAIQRARLGERVAVVDMDLGAPGIGTLLAADEKGTTARWGIVDFWLECSRGEVDLSDYYHVCRRPEVTGGGEIYVVPAGSLDPDRDYLGKLARIDFEPNAESKGDPPRPATTPLIRLLDGLRKSIKPNWILLDGRAGLSEPAGLLLDGLAHLHVLFGTSSEQSWQGLRLILDRLGKTRVLRGERQLDCLLVHALVPENKEVAEASQQVFAARASDEFRDHYYASDPKDPGDDRFAYVRDAEDDDAPSSPVVIPYRPALVFYSDVANVVPDLADSEPYRALASRIADRSGPSEEPETGEGRDEP